jgi:transcriptional regulator with XRE-family HTH domain
MNTKNKVKKKSAAVDYLENLTGGELTFGRLLYSIRKGDEISQVDFAKKLGVSKTQLCDIEKDRRSVSPLRAMTWAKKLGYSPEQFLELALQTSLNKDGIHFKVKLVAAV